jgi:hypothetical protein
MKLRKTLQDGKSSPSSWISRIDTMKMVIPLKTAYRINIISIKILISSFRKVENKSQNSCGKIKVMK